MKHVEYLVKNEVAKQYAFSPAVVTEGGRVVWLSGQIARRDASGNDITGQFEPQVRRIFTLMEQTIREAGGHSLADLVTMTVYVTDTRYLERFVEIRRELFKDAGENYPASTFIGVASLPFPGVVVEIQGTAVIR